MIDAIASTSVSYTDADSVIHVQLLRPELPKFQTVLLQNNLSHG